MKVEYKQGEMIVTHESGHVDKYQRADLESQRALLEQERSENEFKINANNREIAKTISSIGVI